MQYETIRYTEDNNIAVVTLNRPEVLNALNTQMRAEITYAVRDAAKTARVIVLTGEGRAFCSGQDLGDGVDAATADLERTLRDEYEPMVHAIHDSPVPTIAAVNGTAAGAGASLALSCDVVIATHSAVFLQAFSRIGLIPDAGGTYMLPRLAGLARAMGAALFADEITATQAMNWGMIYEAVADADFEAHWQARAAYLAKGPTASYRYLKDAMHASYDNTLKEQLALEAKLQNRCGQTRDFKEGVMAFLEKRNPRYEGR
ncbi:enoyl-CoA hydratase-related protein [Celeribacter halophilus]|uniref:2-(1,2-epoxy-1,2-dihydrophenyl)acetyl-CoA isomerase n=1 Tax=Celeribacter halophilus TaxID=576117 RepID=A0A1I3NXI7_9RHOB|nr:enoyl-CoA hydratase-related protein [Celeribacter halophilus]PZX14680.1 2-(1,2-epoxy-1,2-dihydrophenyl)acetyl-CoA isomerase [Celeribacter halophilus]SFJ14005.1 2-(1,2-epoxy-1,2-dihydrophenyl)acetyl-CoA isomerase [Celeribacter halophilus]